MRPCRSGAEGEVPEVSLDAAAGLEAAAAPADEAVDTAQQVQVGYQIVALLVFHYLLHQLSAFKFN